jgi:DME family drug/metabolite transporter
MLPPSMVGPTRTKSPAQPRAHARSGALLVLAAAALWSTGGVGVKTAQAEPLVIAGLRSVFALIFLLGVLAVTTRRARVRTTELFPLLRRPLVWAAAASYALMVVLYVLAARRTTAANAILLQYAAPIYVALLSGPLLGERVTRRDLGLVGVCVLGVGLTFGGELGAGRALGNVLAIASGFGFAGLPLFLRMDQRKLAPELAALAPLFTITFGNVLAVLVALPAIVLHPPAGDAALRTWLALAALGTLQIGLPYVLYGEAVRRLRALQSSLLAMIEPVLSPIWVVLATGERPSAHALVGGAVIIAAVAAQSLSRAVGAERG